MRNNDSVASQSCVTMTYAFGLQPAVPAGCSGLPTPCQLPCQQHSVGKMSLSSYSLSEDDMSEGVSDDWLVSDDDCSVLSSDDGPDWQPGQDTEDDDSAAGSGKRTVAFLRCQKPVACSAFRPLTLALCGKN